MIRYMALLAAVAALPASGELNVTYTAKTMTVSGASAGGDVAVYGVVHRHYEAQETVHSEMSVVRADETGQAVVEVSEPSFRSIWLIVDLRSGSHIVSTPPGFTPNRLAIPSGAFEPNGRRLFFTRPSLEVFVVRRGAGAWHAHVADSDANDTDTRRGHVAFGVQSMRRVASGPPPPEHLTPGDVIMVVDTLFFQFWAGELTPGHLPGLNNAH